jgi:hypothetical protein
MGAVKEAREYRFTGSATLTSARLGDLTMDGVFRVERLSLQGGPGNIYARAR